MFSLMTILSSKSRVFLHLERELLYWNKPQIPVFVTNSFEGNDDLPIVRWYTYLQEVIPWLSVYYIKMRATQNIGCQADPAEGADVS